MLFLFLFTFCVCEILDTFVLFRERYVVCGPFNCKMSSVDHVLFACSKPSRISFFNLSVRRLVPLSLISFILHN